MIDPRRNTLMTLIHCSKATNLDGTFPPAWIGFGNAYATYQAMLVKWGFRVPLYTFMLKWGIEIHRDSGSFYWLVTSTYNKRRFNRPK
ncbi:hypothetical protein Q3G72_032831 [Acer saccharum]|nr:hypothetical protein Q3G72_032831 [Acer saccharum]